METNNLTNEEIKKFKTDGIIVPSNPLPDNYVTLLKTALDKLIYDNPDIRPEKLVSAHIENGTEGVKGSQIFLDIALDEIILNLISQLIGEDIILWGCQVFCKPGGDGMIVPWHQDGKYWPIRPLATCTVWIAIDDSTIENGCLRVIPGSHSKKKIFQHDQNERKDIVLDQELDSRTFEESKAKNIELTSGKMSIHDVYLMHGSRANNSTKRRAGLALRYMTSTSYFDRDIFKDTESISTYKVDYSQRPIWLAKGVDRCGMNNFKIGH